MTHTQYTDVSVCKYIMSDQLLPIVLIHKKYINPEREYIKIVDIGVNAGYDDVCSIIITDKKAFFANKFSCNIRDLTYDEISYFITDSLKDIYSIFNKRFSALEDEEKEAREKWLQRYKE